MLLQPIIHLLRMTLIPPRSPTQMNFVYNEAVESGHRNCLRVLEILWLRCTHKYTPSELSHLRKLHGDVGDPPETRDYYINMRTSLCQWTQPYHPRIFHAQDIEIDDFVQMCIQYDVLAKR